MDTYSYGSDYAAVGGILGLFLGIMVVFIIIALVLGILHIIGLWKMFKKAKEEGWKAIVPIYNTYTLCKIVGVNPWWILIVLLSPILGLIPVIGSLASTAVSIYFTIILAVSTAKSYGKGNGRAVGLVLRTPVFIFALGTEKSEYEGQKPMNDPVMDKIMELFNNKEENANIKQKSTSSNNQNVKYCSSCGTKSEEDTKFCPNCGKQI